MTAGNYLGGRFVASTTPDAELVIRSPADQHDVVGTHAIVLAAADEAVAHARAAFDGWRNTDEAQRHALLNAYQERLTHHRADIANTISREVGKPLWEADAEVGAMIGKVDIMLGPGARYTEPETVARAAGEIHHRPLGVLTIIGPFNFPGHLPNGQLVPALALGNTVVFKPSERAPGVGHWIARCIDEAGFPPGVCNVVQGGADVATQLTTHADIDGILFTGSVAVGKAIVQANAHRPQCLIALELGGKNASIVLDDADIQRAARQIAFSAFATAGQRCTASSRVLVTPGVHDALVDQLKEAAERIVVGYPLDDDVFMGPMISELARARLGRAVTDARQAGFQAVVAGGAETVAGRTGWYVRPSVHLAPNADIEVAGYTHDELFGPDVAVYPITNLEHGIELANQTRYGLAAAVFTEDERQFRHAAAQLRVGVVHCNRATAGASGLLPFGGIGESGNHRPAGLFAGLSCSYPQALRLAPDPDEPTGGWPGLRWD